MHLYLFDKPIKSLYSHLLVVSVLLASFHFKVKRKSLYHFQQVIIMAPRKHPCSYCIFGHAKNLKREDKYVTTPNNNSLEAAHSITVKKNPEYNQLKKLDFHWHYTGYCSGFFYGNTHQTQHLWNVNCFHDFFFLREIFIPQQHLLSPSSLLNEQWA